MKTLLEKEKMLVNSISEFPTMFLSLKNLIPTIKFVGLVVEISCSVYPKTVCWFGVIHRMNSISVI